MAGTIERAGAVFEVLDIDLAGRLATLTVGGKRVKTPELMPVVNPNKLALPFSIPPQRLHDELGFKMIITNSYIIGRTDELRSAALDNGLHRMLGFDGVIMTDSGTFQSYIYGGGKGGEVDVDPLSIVEFQRSIGSDIGTVLDRFTAPECTRGQATANIDETMKRARASMEVRGVMELAVPVQGGAFPDLRSRSGREVFELGCRYAPIGGVVPIMENYEYPLLVDVIVAAKAGLGPSIPSHLFGAGHPMVLPLAVALGCDLFDSASYAKYASDGRYMTATRTMHLSELDSFPCSCPVCSRHDPSDLRAMAPEESASMLAWHNLWTIRAVLNEVRGSLKEGTLWEMVERFALSNPWMYAATRRLRHHEAYLEENAPRSLRRFLCSTHLSLCRPEYQRYINAFKEQYQMPKDGRALLMSDWTLSRTRLVSERMGKRCPEGVWPVVKSPLGPIPYDIIDQYPLTQSIFPPPGSLDGELEEWMSKAMMAMEINGIEVLDWDGKSPLPIEPAGRDRDVRDIEMVIKLLRMQFGRDEGGWADELVFGPGKGALDLKERLSLVRSRSNDRVRNVLEKGGAGGDIHLISIRAEDGLINLKPNGAARMLKGSRAPRWRVVVDSETGEYNARGYNVFCRFVASADPSIRPLDEVIVVDETDRLLAVGKAVVPSRMMLEASSGVAVKVREGTQPKDL